jgi:hypothetical protein
MAVLEKSNQSLRGTLEDVSEKLLSEYKLMEELKEKLSAEMDELRTSSLSHSDAKALVQEAEARAESRLESTAQDLRTEVHGIVQTLHQEAAENKLAAEADAGKSIIFLLLLPSPFLSPLALCRYRGRNYTPTTLFFVATGSDSYFQVGIRAKPRASLNVFLD